MLKRWRLGTLLGFPVEVNLSFLLMLGVVYLWLGGVAGLFVRATDASVTVSRVFALLFAIAGVSGGSFQLLLLAPILWAMGTREKLLARHMASQYRYDGGGYAHRGDDEPEVMRGDARRFVIRDHRGVWVINVD